MPDARPLVAVRCDGTPSTGLGHVMRCLALAEGLTESGADVVFLGDIRGGARQLVEDLGGRVLDAPTDSLDLLTVLTALQAGALVVDSYEVPATTYADVRAGGLPVAAVVDAPAPELDADLLVNPNPGSERAMATAHRGRVLAGGPCALLRRDVTRRRPPQVLTSAVATRVLVVLGGTDVRRAAPQVAELVLATGASLHVDVVCADEALHAQAATLRTAPGQTVTPHPPRLDLASLAVAADLVVSAGGTTTLELACLGKTMAVIVVADNQRSGCRSMVEAGAAVALGEADDLSGSAAAITATLAGLLQDHRRRASLARLAHGLVDGLGRHRVAAAVRGLVTDSKVATMQRGPR